MIFALVQTIGKSTYQNKENFQRDHFDYIIIGEFHYAVSNNYKIDNDVYSAIKNKFLLNPLNNYIELLKQNGEIYNSEEKLYNSRGREFINMIETTSISKSYKMPMLLAF